jgi:hypothetical protein
VRETLAILATSAKRTRARGLCEFGFGMGMASGSISLSKTPSVPDFRSIQKRDVTPKSQSFISRPVTSREVNNPKKSGITILPRFLCDLSPAL